MENNVTLNIFAVSMLIEIATALLLRNNNLILKLLSSVNVSLIALSSAFFLLFSFSTVTVMLMIVSLFRIINISRIVHGKMNQKELTSRYIRTLFWLTLVSIILVYLFYYPIDLALESIMYISVLGSMVLFLTTIHSMIRWRYRKLPEESLKILPTVSICIPARNETHDLPECIETALASTYPKLEILVLDDCSHDKTPVVIKDYAHKGVRFIKGQEPGKNWIAKNNAMDMLFDESRGDIVIFAGVDVRFSPKSVYHIVEQFEHGSLDMVSILPERTGSAETSVFIQPLRYWWELSVPRLLGKRPPALSSIWAIRRKKLIEIGSFESVKRSIRPEAHFATRLSSSYRFVLSGSRLGLTSVKRPRDQFDTAMRMRYPQARRRPESVLAVMSIEIVVFILPVIALIRGLSTSDGLLVVLGLVSLSLLVAINGYISYLTVKKSWLLAAFTLPFLVLEEFYVLIRSMVAYEFGDVRWKERNICLPMLQPEKELPKI